MPTLLEPGAGGSRESAARARLRQLEKRLETEHAIARLLTDTPKLSVAAPELLSRLGDLVDADLGELWIVDGDERLRAVAIWSRAPSQFGEFVADSLRRQFKRGVGLPGRVWERGEAAIIPDLGADANFPRRAAAAAVGLASGVAMPVAAGGECLGVVELFWIRPTTPDGETMLTLTAIGHAIAQAVRVQRHVTELEQANRQKDLFLATLSHELRTPMNAVLGWLRMVSSGALAPDQWSRAIGTIERNARAQARLIDDLLDISRIVSGRLEIDRVPVDLAAAAASVVEGLRPAADARCVRLSADIPDSPLAVIGDPRRLEQILLNLLNNALKFTPPGGDVRVSVRADHGWAVTIVADSGIGIRSEFIPFLFERFRQSDSSHAREHGGLGLGLAIAQHLVELHGGAIEAESGGPGQGATFTVRLPLR